MPIVLVGNKYDLLGDNEDIIVIMQKFARSIKCFHNVCSAKTDFNIEVMFSLMMSKMLQNHKDTSDLQDAASMFDDDNSKDLGRRNMAFQ